MEAYKKTALRLHGLSESDCRWLLEQLPEHQREKLTSMLDELKTLGIPREPMLQMDLDDLARNSGLAAHESQAGHAPSRFIQIITDADPVAVSAILSREPDPVIAAVLRISDWPWRQAVLENLSLTRQSLSSEAFKNQEGRLTEKARGAVLEILAERLGDTPILPEEVHDHAAGEAGRTRRWSFLRRRPWQK